MGLRICPEPCFFSASLPSDYIKRLTCLPGLFWANLDLYSWCILKSCSDIHLGPVESNFKWSALAEFVFPHVYNFFCCLSGPQLLHVPFWLSQASLSSAPKSLKVFISTYKEKLPSGQHTSQLHPILLLQSIKLFISLDCVPFLSFVQTNFWNCHIIVIVMLMQAENLPSVCLLIKTVIPHFKNNVIYTLQNGLNGQVFCYVFLPQ